VTHRALLQEVWGPQHGGATHYLRVHFAHIRHDRNLLERARAVSLELASSSGPLQDAVDRLFAGADIEA